MRTKFEFGSVLAVLALVATACFGGSSDEATLALDAAQIADVAEVPIADLPPEPTGEVAPELEAEEEDEEEGDPPDDGRPTPPEVHDYADDEEMAASMVLVPADIADDYPGLIVDSLNTGTVTNLMAVARKVSADEGALLAVNRVAGYESTLLAVPTAEVAEGALLVGADTAMGPAVTRVDLFLSEADAAAWLADEFATYRVPPANLAVTRADAAAGLPGEAFVATHTVVGSADTTFSVAGFSRGTVVGTAQVQGDETGEDALALARALAMRSYQVQQALVPARDPSPENGLLHVPHERLESFRAVADVAVRDGDAEVWRHRRNLTYRDQDHYTCNGIVRVGGTETLEWDLTVDGSTAWYFADAAASSRVAVLDGGVANVYRECLANPDTWRGRYVHGFDGIPAGRGATAAGPAAAYESADGDVVAAAFGWTPGDGELLHYQEYVAEDGWSVAFTLEQTMRRGDAEERYGDLPGSGAQVTVRETVRTVDATGEELTLGAFIDVEAVFGLDVGEEIELVLEEPEPPPAEEAEAVAEEHHHGEEASEEAESGVEEHDHDH